jgi:hypothetical protein
MTVECARCGRAFVRRRSDHRFCGPTCRKLGERAPWEPPPDDPDAIDRLFDEERDPGEVCRPDDWYPHVMTASEQEVYLCQPSPDGRWRGDTVESRRRLFLGHFPSAGRDAA